MRERTHVWRIVGIALVSVAVAIATWVLATSASDGLIATCASGFVVIGGFLMVRARGNVVGCLLVAFGLSVGLWMLGASYAHAGLPGAAWVAWATSLVWLPALVVLAVLLPLYFPDGQLIGGRWRWALVAAAVGCLGMGLGNAFTSELLDEFGMQNPAFTPLPESLVDGLPALGLLGLLLAIGSGVGAVVRRFRSSSDLMRHQIKWFAFSALMLVPAILANSVLYESKRQDVGFLVLMLGAIGVAVSIAIAVLRYRLYDIDRIVSRTISYTIVVGLLGGTVAIVATTVSAQFESPLVVAATTLGVAAVFNPLRHRVQRWVDRRFNRSRYNAERVMDEFARSLRDDVDETSVVDGWQGVVTDTLHPSAVGVWVRR